MLVNVNVSVTSLIVLFSPLCFPFGCVCDRRRREMCLLCSLAFFALLWFIVCRGSQCSVHAGRLFYSSSIFDFHVFRQFCIWVCVWYLKCACFIFYATFCCLFVAASLCCWLILVAVSGPQSIGLFLVCQNNSSKHVPHCWWLTACLPVFCIWISGGTLAHFANSADERKWWQSILASFFFSSSFGVMCQL